MDSFKLYWSIGIALSENELFDNDFRSALQ